MQNDYIPIPHTHTGRSLSFLPNFTKYLKTFLINSCKYYLKLWATHPLQLLCFMVWSSTDSINSLEIVSSSGTHLTCVLAVWQLDVTKKTEFHKQRMLELRLVISIDVKLLGYFLKLGHFNIHYFILPLSFHLQLSNNIRVPNGWFTVRENLAFCLRSACNSIPSSMWNT